MKGRLDLWTLLVLLALVFSIWNIYVGIQYREQISPSPLSSADSLDRSAVIDTNKTTAAQTSLHRPDSIRHREPTHHACDGLDGIYHVAMTDILGGVGTGLIQLVVNQIDYARRHRLKPWVHLNNSSHVIYDPLVHGRGRPTGVHLTAMRQAEATYVRRPGGHWRDAVPGPPNMTDASERDFVFDGTGIWDHYFEPVSDFVPGDVSCQHKLLVNMDLYLITPGLHGYSEYATRCWRYEYLPEYITKPHVPYDSWIREQRLRAHNVMQEYIHFKPYLRDAARQVNPGCSRQVPCLGLHIRHSDKAAGRRLVATSEFLPFAQAFVDNGGSQIYLATDSSAVLDEIRTLWPAGIQRRIRRMGNNVVRSKDQKAVFDIASHHQTNKEALTEILALSQCQYMVHGLSAVSESSIWINIGLHNRSVNLEDPEHIGALSFGNLVSMSMIGRPEVEWPQATRTDEWWKRIDSVPVRPLTPNSCQGYKGVLLVSAVSAKSSAAAAFFTDALNQLLYAKRNNLIPWIHLQNGTDLISDSEAHELSTISTTLKALVGDESQPQKVNNSIPLQICPSDFAPSDNFRQRTVSLYGNGIWNSYFRPASDFSLSDPTCSALPLVTMDERLVAPVLKSLCSDSVKAWRYDAIPAWQPGNVSSHEWYAEMRRTANDVVKEHYSFLPHIARRAALVNPTEANQPCLGVHIRVGDKVGAHVKKVKADKYVPYLEAFQRAGGKSIYIASDSHRAIQYVMKSVPDKISMGIRTQGPWVVRTYKDYSTHLIDNHHRVNSETLVDILALSKCSFLLHSHSTVSEAAIYLNRDLHNNSVNLEDADRISPNQFEDLIKRLNNKLV